MSSIRFPNFGPEADPVTDWCNLHYASAVGELTLVKKHIKHYSLVNALDTWSRTPLHYAALNGRVKVYKYLRKKGANPKLVDKHGKTASQYLIETALQKAHTAIETANSIIKKPFKFKV